MLDFSKMTDFLTEMAGNVQQGASAEPQGLLDLLGSAGLDPSALTDLSEGEITTLLGEHGIDVSQFAPEELTNVLGNLGLGDVLGEAPGNGVGLSILQGLFEQYGRG